MSLFPRGPTTATFDAQRLDASQGFIFPRAPPPVYRRGIARLIVVVDVAVAVSHPRHDALQIGVTFFAVNRRKPGAVDEAVAGLVVV